jgi:hypothetical protein
MAHSRTSFGGGTRELGKVLWLTSRTSVDK